MGMGLYTEIWKSVLPGILEVVKNGKSGSYTLKDKEELFKTAGNRKTYSFRADFEDGICTSNLDGTAVGRDLRDVVTSSAEFRKVCQGKSVTIRMGKNFDFHIEIY